MYNKKNVTSLLILWVFIVPFVFANVFGTLVLAEELTSESASESMIVGDVNGDGIRNSIDFALMRTVLLGLKGSFPVSNGEWASDTDGNGVFNSIDFAFMRKLLLGFISVLPAESNTTPTPTSTSTPTPTSTPENEEPKKTGNSKTVYSIGEVFDNGDFQIVVDRVEFASEEKKFHIYGRANFNGKRVVLSVFDATGTTRMADFISFGDEQDMSSFEAVLDTRSTTYNPEEILIKVPDKTGDKMVKIAGVEL